MRAESSGTSHQIIQPPPVPESLLSTHSSLESFAQSEHQDPSQCQTPRSTLVLEVWQPVKMVEASRALHISRNATNKVTAHCTLHDSKNTVGSIVLCNRLTRYLMITIVNMTAQSSVLVFLLRVYGQST